MGLLFEGLKVIDCGSFIAAPAAATILSDFGADVVKIEPPGAGDPYRHLTELPGHPKSDQNYAWMLGSRNKRSLAVDMGKPEGRTAVQRLASQADVFITNYPAADLRVVLRIWRKRRRGDQAGLRCHGMVGAVGFDGHRSRVVGVGTGATRERHGRSLCRFHALFRHRDGALSAPKHW